jgi:hypothetical protein
MSRSIHFTWQLPLNQHLPSTETDIRGSLAVAIPPEAATPVDAGIPRIVSETIAECLLLPEVSKHRQEVGKAEAIERRMRECSEQLAELAEQRAHAGGVDQMLAITETMRARQAALDALKENAELIAEALPSQARAAYRAVQVHCDGKLNECRSASGRAAHNAREHANALLETAAAKMGDFAAAKPVLAAIEAHVAARRAAAASRLLNGSVASILEEIQAAVGVSAN